MMNSRFDEGLDGFLRPLQTSKKDPVPVILVDTIQTGNGVAEEVLPFFLLIDDSSELEACKLQIKVGQFSHLPGSEKENGSYLFALHFLILVQKKVFDVLIEIDGIPEVFGGEFALPCKAFRSEEVLQSFSRQSFDFEVTLGCEPFHKRVDQPHGKIESLRELPLTGAAVSVYFAKQLKDMEILFIHGSTPAIPLLVHNRSTFEQQLCSYIERVSSSKCANLVIFSYFIRMDRILF
jgi:hypothetical protein